MLILPFNYCIYKKAVAIFPKGKLPQLTIPVIHAQNAYQNKASKKLLGIQKIIPIRNNIKAGLPTHII